MAERRRELVGPLVLIGLGVLFLLYNLGLLGREVWVMVWRFWPLVLVAAGCEIIFARRFPWTTFLIGLVVLVVAGFFSISNLVFRLAVSEEGQERDEAPIAIAERLDGARRARIEIEAGVAELHLDGSAAPSFLVEGTIFPGPGEELRRSFRIEDGRAFFTLQSKGIAIFPAPRRWHGRRFWELRLSREIPLEIEVKTGVGLSVLDLRSVKATKIEVRTGVGRTTLTLPERGVLEASLQGGVGETVVYIPKGMAVRIRARQGLGGIELKGEWRHTDGEYLSPDYPTAANRADLELKGGVGRIVVREG
ncbi:MAG: LiaI-LiaF-like domain-containing protein [Bacillota bacterium]